MKMDLEQRMDRLLVAPPAALTRLIYGSVGAEFWSSWTTAGLSLAVLLHPRPAGQRGYLLDLAGDRVMPLLLGLLVLIGAVHFVLLLLPNSRPTVAFRKAALAVEFACWSTAAYDLLRFGQGGSLVGIVILLALMVVALLRRNYALP